VGESSSLAGKHLSTPSAAHQTDLALVVPVYNEAENFPRFYRSIVDHVRTPWRLLVVYDREEDTTLPVAREIAASDPRVELVLNTGRGVLGALKTGLTRPTHGWVVVTSDGADVVCPSRYMRGGALHGAPLVKGTLSRLAGLTLKLLARLPTADPTNNYKLYSVDYLRSVSVESTGGFEVALELTVKAHLQGRRIVEMPTVWQERTAGTSRFKLRKWLPRYLRWYLAALAGR